MREVIQANFHLSNDIVYNSNAMYVVPAINSERGKLNRAFACDPSDQRPLMLQWRTPLGQKVCKYIGKYTNTT
jgi:hypothetical protein